MIDPAVSTHYFHVIITDPIPDKPQGVGVQELHAALLRAAHQIPGGEGGGSGISTMYYYTIIRVINSVFHFLFRLYENEEPG